MKRNWRRFQACERGSLAVVFAFVLIPIAGAVGIALDFARASHARTALQSATDAAALSAAKSSIAQADRSNVASSVFAANIGTGGFAVGATPTVTVGSDKVTVATTFPVPTTITKVLGFNSLPVTVTSSVAFGSFFGGASSACVLALSETADGAFYVNGTTNFQAIGCSVMSNSAHAQSIRGVGAPDVTAASFCAVGQYDINSGFSPLPSTGCSPVPDPFASLPAPAMDDCDTGAKKTSVKKGAHSLSPGTFCGGLELMAQAEVTFDPGVYVIRNGPLIFRSGSISAGDGVFFYVTGTDALVKVNGGADVVFKGPGSGAYAGMVFAQDKTSNAGDTSIIQGGGNVQLTGGLYFPTQTLEISGNGDLGQDVAAWSIVADQVHLKGNGTVQITANFGGAGLPDLSALPTNTIPRILN